MHPSQLFRHTNGFNYVSIIIFLVIVALLPFIAPFSGDNYCWGIWCVYIHEHGLKEAYGSGTNYLPLYQYVLWAFGKMAGSEAGIWRALPFLRTITLGFDFAGIWILWKWLDKRYSYNFLLICCVVNLAWLYDTIFFGQVDGIETTLLFAAMYAACRQKLTLSGVLFLLAINMKLQAIVFVPVWLLLVIIPAAKAGWMRILKMVIAMAILQLMIFWPFMYGKGGLDSVWVVVTGSLSKMPQLSANAYNWWYWTTSGGYPGDVSDDKIFLLGLTAKQLGLILFFSSSAVALWPLIKLAYRSIRKKVVMAQANDRKTIWLVAALIGLLFFFCNTEMHERYAHPTFIFLTAYAFMHKKFGLYILFSLAYLLNLEGACRWLSLPNYETVLFDGRVIAGLYLLVIIGIFRELYRPVKGIENGDDAA